MGILKATRRCFHSNDPMGSPSSTQTLAFVVLALLLCQGSKGWQTTDSGQEIQLSEWLKHLPQGNIKILLYGNDTQANATIQAIASNELRNISTTASHCHSKTSLHGVKSFVRWKMRSTTPTFIVTGLVTTMRTNCWPCMSQFHFSSCL